MKYTANAVITPISTDWNTIWASFTPLFFQKRENLFNKLSFDISKLM